MKLTDFICDGAIIPELDATDRNGVIRELVEAVAKDLGLEADVTETLVDAAIARENQGSTGFGKGVAVPHVKSKAIKKLAGGIGRSSRGIDFAALDRAPVYIVFLLLSPEDDPDQHLAAMENIFRHLQHDNFRRFLRQAGSHGAIQELLREADDAPQG